MVTRTWARISQWRVKNSIMLKSKNTNKFKLMTKIIPFSFKRKILEVQLLMAQPQVFTNGQLQHQLWHQFQGHSKLLLLLRKVILEDQPQMDQLPVSINGQHHPQLWHQSQDHSKLLHLPNRKILTMLKNCNQLLEEMLLIKLAMLSTPLPWRWQTPFHKTIEIWLENKITAGHILKILTQKWNQKHIFMVQVLLDKLKIIRMNKPKRKRMKRKLLRLIRLNKQRKVKLKRRLKPPLLPLMLLRKIRNHLLRWKVI